jgi:hypothetical protein
LPCVLRDSLASFALPSLLVMGFRRHQDCIAKSAELAEIIRIHDSPFTIHQYLCFPL